MQRKRQLIVLVALIFLLGACQPNMLPGNSEPSTPESTPRPTAVLTAHPDIQLTSPQDGNVVTSPLTITGQAKGSWFFEATFPVVLTDWDGRIIAETYATAQGEWMNEDFVPFTAEITFTADTTVSNRGALILKKANASGLPEHDDAYEITVFFE